MRQAVNVLMQAFFLFGCCEARAFLRGYGGTAYSLTVFGMVCLKQWLMQWTVAGDMYNFLVLMAALPAGVNVGRTFLSPLYSTVISPWHPGGKYVHYLTFGLVREKYLLIVELAVTFLLALQCAADPGLGRSMAWWQYFYPAGQRLLPDLTAAPAWYHEYYGDIALLMPFWTFLCLCAVNGSEWRQYGGDEQVQRTPPETRQELTFHRVEMTK
jgi:hypothetical protein